MARVDGLASVVQVYTAGLRFETEPMVCVRPAASPVGTRELQPSLHRLPLQCPLLEVDEQDSSAWTALWQASCLLRPEVSPVLWRQRIRRLARIIKGFPASADGLEPFARVNSTDGLKSVSLRKAAELKDPVLGMSEWVQRLMPAGMLGTSDRFQGVVVSDSAALDLKSLESCVRSGGVALLAWKRSVATRSALSTQALIGMETPRHWQWRVVAGVEGLKALNRHFQSRSVLLLPQDTEAVWGCGFGGRLDPLVHDVPEHVGCANRCTWRSLDGAKATVEVCRVLLIRLHVSN